MASITFLCKSEQKKRLATIYARLRAKNTIDITVQTSFLVPSGLWLNKSQNFKADTGRSNLYSGEFTKNDANQILNRLEGLRYLVLSEFNSRDNLAAPVTKEWLSKIVFEYENPTIGIEEDKIGVTLNSYIDEYMHQAESGERLNRSKKRFQPATLKSMRNFVTRFHEYQKLKRRTIDFNDIDRNFYNDFVNFFIKKDFSPNTIGRNIKYLKGFMRAAKEEGLHNNSATEHKDFTSFKAEVQEIYLTDDELKTLYELDLGRQPTLDVARDVFLVGCYTAQRYSDYSAINEKNIRCLEGGICVIDLTQKKTGERVIIPVRPELAAILEKYGFNLPHTYEQKINARIKEVCQLAGIDELITIHLIRGGKNLSETLPKYKLVKTHTARRSGATNMYLAGIPTIDIMKLTGHRTESEFLKYIKVTKEETAHKLLLHPYFSGK